jgi:hypothetical protein
MALIAQLTATRFLLYPILADPGDFDARERKRNEARIFGALSAPGPPLPALTGV